MARSNRRTALRTVHLTGEEYQILEPLSQREISSWRRCYLIHRRRPVRTLAGKSSAGAL
jgi:hypothetical protein